MECGVFIVGCLFKGDRSLGIKVEKTANLLGGLLLLLLLLLLGIGVLLRLGLRGFLNGGGLLNLGLLLEDYMIKTKDVIGLFVAVKEEPKVEEPAPVEEAPEAEPEEDADAKKKKKKKKKA